ncbi:MAG: diguanylate cyclase [Pseudomonadota bacterium]
MQRRWRLFRHWLKRRYLRRVEPGRLWIRYGLALGVVLVLLGTSHYAALHSLSSTARDAALINESGKLRMLSQRVLHLSHHLVTKPSIESQQAYAESVDAFELIHVDLAAIATNDPILDQVYFGGRDAVAPQIVDFIAEARKLEVNPPQGPADLAALDAIGTDRFLNHLYMIVGGFEAVANRNASERRDIHGWLLNAAILVILLEALIIFWPTQHAVNAALKSLQEENERKRVTLRRLRGFSALAADLFWETDINGQVTYLEGRLKQTVSRGKTLVGRDYLSFIELAPDQKERLMTALATEQPYSGVLCEYTDIEGRVFTLELSGAPLRDEDGTTKGFFGTVDDVTERVEAAERVIELAHTDALTGLGNKRSFDLRLEDLSSAKNDKGYCLIAVDLDGFKPVNDTYGHGAGDEALQVVAERISGLIRATDTAYRTGGDEFCIVCYGLTTLFAVDALTRRLQRALAETYTLNEADVRMSASLGVAVSSSGRDLPEDVVTAADQALLDAKKSGRNCIRFAPVGGYTDLNIAQAS